MRFAARLSGVLLLLVGISGCDTDSIAQKESQTVGLTVSASNLSAELYNVWDMIEDNNADGMADDGVTYLFCTRINLQGGPPSLNVTSLPWPFSIRVSVLRADATEFEQVTASSFLDPTSNLTQYDTTTTLGNQPKQPITINDNGVMRTFRFRNERRLTAMNRSVAAAVTNPLSTFDPVTYGYRMGKCSQGYPGDPRIAGVAQPYTFELGKGDTIRIEVRKSLTPAQFVNLSAGQSPTMFAAFTVDGVRVQLPGTSASQAAGDGFSFFYTSR